jgi:dihydroflavonol-4-reductase
MSRRALVTGATGFIGGHLIERLLDERWQVRALVRRESDASGLRRLDVEVTRGDLSKADRLCQACANVDAVFHLAGVTAARLPEGYWRTNVDGTRALVEALPRLPGGGGRFVYLSSYAACGPSNGRPRMVTDPPRPLSTYGRTKLAGETVARSAEACGVAVTIIRAPAVYGPGDRALLSYFRLVQWRIAPIPVGADRRRLHLIFAPDLARALVRAVDHPPGTYAVAEPVEHTWAEIVDVLSKTLRRRPVRVPVPALLLRSAAAVSEAAAALRGRAVIFNREKADEMLAPGWTCELADSQWLLPPGDVTPLVEGFARTSDWYKSKGWL